MSKEEFSLGVKHQIFNNEVRKRRLERGLTQKQLGKICGRSNGFIGHIETLRTYPSLEDAEMIATALGSTVRELFPKWINEFKKYRNSVVTEHIITERLLENPDLLSLPDPEDMEDKVNNEILKDDIDKALGRLSEREKKVMELRFGLRGGSPKHLDEVGAILGVSRERVRQIEARVFRKLKTWAAKGENNLKDYL
jgi:RNA polymerase sigma factor (sigma-70 family)